MIMIKDWDTFGWARSSWAKLSWKQRSREFLRKLRGQIPRNLTRDVFTEGSDGVEGEERVERRMKEMSLKVLTSLKDRLRLWRPGDVPEGSDGSEGQATSLKVLTALKARRRPWRFWQLWRPGDVPEGSDGSEGQVTPLKFLTAKM